MMINILNCCKNRLRSTVCITKFFQQQRSCSMMKTSEAMEALLKKSDRIPNTYYLIYRIKQNALYTTMYHTINLCAFTTFGGAAYFYYKWYTGTQDDLAECYQEVYEEPFQYFILLLINIGIVIGASMLRTRLAIRIYKDSNKGNYRAIFNSRVPFHVEYYDFPDKSLSYVAKNSVMPVRCDLYKIENHKKKIFLYREKFKTHDDFYRMLRPDQLEL